MLVVGASSEEFYPGWVTAQAIDWFSNTICFFIVSTDL
jgi:hypothetical protein